MPFVTDREFDALPRTPQFEVDTQQLADLHKNQDRSKAICVIGGGIAGLTAAYELLNDANQYANHHVVLLEATNRVGGRVHTWRPHKDQKDVHGELAPMRVPPNHHGTMHYIDNVFGLKKGIFIQSNPNGWCQVGGAKYRRSEFDLLLRKFGVSLSRPWYRKGQDPQAALAALIDHHLGRKLADHAILDGTLDPTTRAFDRISLWQFLREIDVKPLYQNNAVDPNAPTGYARRRPGRRGHKLSDHRHGDQILSEAAWEVLSRASGQRWREGLSALEEWVESAGILGGDNRIRLVEGMDSLPTAFADAIRARGGTIELDNAVTRVQRTSGPHPMHIFYEDRKTREVHELAAPDGRDGFDYVICAAPASATARIEFQPKLPSAQWAALSGIPYQNAAKYLLHMKCRTWEHDATGPIFGGASYTDRIIQQCWYPSDNVHTVYQSDPNSDHEPLIHTVGTGDQGLGKFTIYEVRGNPDPEAWQRPAVLTGAYMTGVNADRFISLTARQQDEAVMSCLNDFHPGIRNDVCCVKTWPWMEQTTPGGGAWTLYEPGGRERYWQHLRKSHPANEPRVFFAGEHLSLLHGWIQSAIETSLEATIAVLKAR